MKKRLTLYTAVWAVWLALFNAVCFIPPHKSGPTFWVGYVIITLAFISHLLYALLAFKAKDRQAFFCSLPLITLSWTGLLLTAVFGGLCMVIPALPIWVGALVGLLCPIFTVAAVLKAVAAAELVNETDEKIRKQGARIQGLIAKAQVLLAAAPADTHSEAETVYEAIRYSDPQSNPLTEEADVQLETLFAAFADAVEQNDAELAQETEKSLLALLAKRNVLCKAGK